VDVTMTLRDESTSEPVGSPDELVDLGGVAPADPIERDRTRLAYAIHDGLTQVVTASVLELDWLTRQAATGPVEAVEALQAAAAHLREALDEIRGVLATLTPSSGVGPSIEELVREMTERWQLPATWSVEGDLQAVPAQILDAASSVIREGLANAAKHADSGAVRVRVLASRHAVEVSVEDHGRGFHPAETGLHAGHLGLEMMRRRVAEVHGTIDVQSAPGRGTRVVARLPVIEQGVSP
jgi:signal transduction histidine kinase